MKYTGFRNLWKAWTAPAPLVSLLVGLTPAARAFEREIPVLGVVRSPVVTIQNMGSSGVLSPRILLRGEPDFVSVEAMAQEACRSAATEREKAEALWNSVLSRPPHACPNPCAGAQKTNAPPSILNDMGSGCCDQLTQTATTVWAVQVRRPLERRTAAISLRFSGRASLVLLCYKA